MRHVQWATHIRGTLLAFQLWTGRVEDEASEVSEFLAMGGYAAYVWPAFGFAGLVLVGLLAQSWHAARRREAEFEKLKRLARPEGQVRPAPRRPVPAREAGIAARAGTGGPGAGT
jgi:heme exporter protein D